jgi:micrococcal nuclease
MDWIISIILVLISLFFDIPQSDAPKISSNEVHVISVIDGDTVLVTSGGQDEKIRLIGINTPEKGECGFNEAKDYLSSLILSQNIVIEMDSTQGEYDKYDRLLAFIFFQDQNINQLMIEHGHAKEYTYDKPYIYQQSFQKAELDAKLSNSGVWACSQLDENTIQASASNPECKIKGNISINSQTKIYHLPSCPDYNKTRINEDSGERWFCEEQDAVNAGWRMARNC